MSRLNIDSASSDAMLSSELKIVPDARFIIYTLLSTAKDNKTAINHCLLARRLSQSNQKIGNLMKRKIFLTIAMLVSGNIFAATDHYVLRDNGYVRHLKVTNTNGEFNVSADVDFESTSKNGDTTTHCSAEISGAAKSTGKDELVMKKHSESEASYCELKIQLSPNGAKIEQSKACENFAVGNCHFSSDGKELVRIK